MDDFKVMSAKTKLWHRRKLTRRMISAMQHHSGRMSNVWDEAVSDEHEDGIGYDALYDAVASGELTAEQIVDFIWALL